MVNSFLSYFLLLFFWGHAMVATAFFLSVFFTKTRTATVVGYTYVLAIGMFGPNVIQVYFDNPDTPAATIFGISVFPPFAFYRGMPSRPLISDSLLISPFRPRCLESRRVFWRQWYCDARAELG